MPTPDLVAEYVSGSDYEKNTLFMLVCVVITSL